jgi:hypothetical protein
MQTAASEFDQGHSTATRSTAGRYGRTSTAVYTAVHVLEFHTTGPFINSNYDSYFYIQKHIEKLYLPNLAPNWAKFAILKC